MSTPPAYAERQIRSEGGEGSRNGTDAGKSTNRPSSVSARTDDCSVSGFCSGYSGYLFFKASFFFLFGNDIENPTAPAESDSGEETMAGCGKKRVKG